MIVSSKYTYSKAYILYCYVCHLYSVANTYLAKSVLFAESLINSDYHLTKEEITEELEVIKKCQKNPEHFAKIYIKYYDQIFLFVNKRVDNLDVTAELTSRIFLKCLKNIGKFKFMGVPFSAWLYKITINEVNLFFRNEARFTRSVSIQSGHLDQLVSEIDYSEPLIDPHVLIPVLLEQLNEDEIQFIELRFFENRSFKEIGYLLSTSEVNAKVKTYRILKKLKKLSENIKYEQ
ncbi:RNA polymerase sigma factor [Fulvivirga lutea]|uniref:Sigma-70 family RNA polymerase sigma factor n=1 Tax=Fulvivirga lutea TaxID=2810512 RepID=A0A974WEY2_9BACT|nr:sigma-70 family RNA polymerase sigma factor [Fulvivirga lutea]QSE96931.1 sigma-70 family RNA polymerase sigma factor [Fulvivirga lutea]